MVKIIVIIFVIVFSLVRAANKVRAGEREKASRMNYGRDEAMRHQEQSDDFDNDFRFLYEDKSVDNVTDEQLNFEDVAEAKSSVTPIDKSATITKECADEEIEEIEGIDDIERWRRSIIDAEILKTKF